VRPPSSSTTRRIVSIVMGPVAEVVLATGAGRLRDDLDLPCVALQRDHRLALWVEVAHVERLPIGAAPHSDSRAPAAASRRFCGRRDGVRSRPRVSSSEPWITRAKLPSLPAPLPFRDAHSGRLARCARFGWKRRRRRRREWSLSGQCGDGLSPFGSTVCGDGAPGSSCGAP